MCRSYTYPEEYKNNMTSGFLDLSPLYGFTEEDTKMVRASRLGRGLLVPDAFFEEGLVRLDPLG